MDASKVLAVADEIEAAETEAMRDFAPRDGVDPIGAAYAAGLVDAIDGGWAKQLRAACGRDAASDASPEPRDVAHMLDMAAFEIAKASIAVSDMLSDLAQSVKTGDRDLSGFKERWLK